MCFRSLVVPALAFHCNKCLGVGTFLRMIERWIIAVLEIDSCCRCFAPEFFFCNLNTRHVPSYFLAYENMFNFFASDTIYTKYTYIVVFLPKYFSVYIIVSLQTFKTVYRHR